MAVFISIQFTIKLGNLEIENIELYLYVLFTNISSKSAFKIVNHKFKKALVLNQKLHLLRFLILLILELNHP